MSMGNFFDKGPDCVQPKPITVRELQDQVHAFAEETFGPGREDAAWKKLFEEIGETLKNPRDPGEWADIFIVLLDLAKMYGVDVGEASVAKMLVNRQRVWTQTETGVMQHIPGAEKPGPSYHMAILTGGPNGGRSPVKLAGELPLSSFHPNPDEIGIYVLERTDRSMGGQDIHYYTYYADGVPF